jgi:tetratricopeptide (TPR) repeat protein
MTKLHRKELKQDEVREKLSEAVKSVSLHTREVIYIITIVIAVGAIAALWSYYEKKQQQQSQALLGTAIKKFQAPVVLDPASNVDSKPEYSYKTETEKYRAALKDFEQIIQKYGNTPAAEVAKYHAGVSAFYLGDNKKAEDYLKQSTRVSERNILYYVSRMALANFYSASGKPDEAVKLIKEAIQKNKNIVPQENLLLQLADIYEKAGKAKESRDTLQKIVDEYKETSASFQAQTRLNELKPK